MEKSTIKDFTDLITWQKARDLAVLVYKITKKFPKEEIFGLVSQIRRAAISISSNIAEGFARSTIKDKNHFYQIAKGSLMEVKSQILLSQELGFFDKKEKDILISMVELDKLLSGLIRSSRSKNA